MSRRNPGEPLRRFSPPRASDALKARVLADAGAAMSRATRPSRADRIWYSTRWRLAFVAALAGLIALETLSPRGTASPAPPAITESAAAAEALGLPTRGWVGTYVVTNDETSRGIAEDSL